MAVRNMEELIELAKKGRKKKNVVVAPHSLDVVQALTDAESYGLIKSVLVGDSNIVGPLYKKLGLQIPEIIHEPNPSEAARIAVNMARNNHVDMIMKGKIETAELVRPVLDREEGIRTNQLLSQVVLFEAPHNNRLMMLTDASINISPTLSDKVQICKNAIKVAKAIGVEVPKVALLAAYEFVNPAMTATVDAACITQMNRRGQINDALIDGPIALDTVLSPEVARQKDLTSPLIGETDILVAPNIESANILYRSIVYFSNVRSCGIVYGAKVPLILLSRAENSFTKLCSIALACMIGENES